MVNTLYLLLGTNVGDRARNLTQATERIIAQIGVVSRQSSVYETEPWGVTNQPNYWNQVLVVETSLEPMLVLNRIHKIEKSLGRERRIRWEARLIDVDMLYFNEQIIEEANLVVPHPRLAERRFVLTPLAEISPEFRHPVWQKTNQELLEVCADPLMVSKL